MSDKQNIDRFFQEKFKDFEVPPSPKVWQGIEAKLKEEKDDRKVVPIWFRYVSIAAALLIGLLITDNIANSTDDNDHQNSVVIEQTPSVNGSKSNSKSDLESNGPKSENPDNIGTRQKVLEPVEENGYETGIASESGNQNNSANSSAGSDKATKLNGAPNGGSLQNNQSRKNQFGNPDVNNAVATADKRKVKKAASAARNKTEKGTTATDTNNTDEMVADVKKTANKNSAVVAKADPPQTTVDSGNLESGNLNNEQQKLAAENKIADIKIDDIKTDTTAIATVVPNTLEELLKEKENKTVTANEPKLNRWQLSTNVAPIYFSSTSNGSPIDARLAQSNKEYKADLAYGVGVRYALNNKFTIRAGVNTVGMEYQTNDLAFVQTSNARALKNVEPNIQGTLIHIEAKSAGSSSLLTNEVESGRKFSSSLSQRTGYIEVPLEMSYKLVDKKFGIELIGGFSTLFLNENSVTLISSGLQMEIGKANNLNDTHFSTNVGVGLRYNFLKNFQFNLEPMFKYQINTFSDSSSLNPYMFGLYTGVNYRF